MNVVWCLLVAASLVYGAVNGCAPETLAAGVSAAGSAGGVLLSFAGIMCLWSGILRLCAVGGFADVIKRALSPFLRLLFKNLNDKTALEYICMNVTANLLGTGNAATPAGTAAMERLDALANSDTPSRDMCTFAVLNTCAPSLVPTTVMALLTAGGLADSSVIIVPVWIVSGVSLMCALAAVRVLCR